MNMTYESIKERGALMVVPSDMVSSLGNLATFAPAAFDPPGPRLTDSARRGRRLMDVWDLLRIVSQQSLLSCRLESEDRRATGRCGIACACGSPISPSMWDGESFEDLWHFDPRWVLGDELVRVVRWLQSY